jgi:DNA repair protein RadA
MLEDLESLPGVGSAIAKKLTQAGYTTVESLAVTPIRELVSKANVGENTAKSIVEEARKALSITFVTAQELWKKRQAMKKCMTGSNKLDSIMGGGIETQAMTEFIGEFSTGKSQLCMNLSVRVQLPQEQGGLGGNSLFIDTEGTFSPERVYQIAIALGLDPNQVLSNIIISRVYTSDHQLLIMDNLAKVCAEEKIKLVVVDSMISHFRSEYIGRENLSERQQKLNSCLHKLIRTAEVYNMAVIVTNQVSANPQAFFGDPNKPAGGNIMAHACTHRVFLRKGKGNSRVARIIDSPYLPERATHFLITEKGIEDDPNEKQDEKQEEET